MPKDKPSWGGRRPNQTGRPASRQGALRVHLTASVDPLTDAYLREQAKRRKESLGQVIDGLVPADPATPADPVDPPES
jgi:hypothetical protein